MAVLKCIIIAGVLLVGCLLLVAAVIYLTFTFKWFALIGFVLVCWMVLNAVRAERPWSDWRYW